MGRLLLHLLINADPQRLPVLEAVLEQAQRSDGKLQIVTSVISKIEVAFSLEESTRRRLDSQEEERINNLWLDTSVIKLVEVHELIADRARIFIREAMTRRLSLKAADAIHLATAASMGTKDFHTYDTALFNPGYASITGLTISEPTTPQPMLDLS